MRFKFDFGSNLNQEQDKSVELFKLLVTYFEKVSELILDEDEFERKLKVIQDDPKLTKELLKITGGYANGIKTLMEEK